MRFTQGIFFGFGGLIFSALAYGWGHATGSDSAYRRAYVKGWDAGHAAGWVKGVSDAGVLDRLVALDELQNDAEFRQAAGMRRHRGAIEAWIAEARKWA